jgi:hypothetical protein
MKAVTALAALLATIPAAPAAAMDVATFLAKAEALQRQGMLAALSSDAPLVQAEITGSIHALRTERLAAQAAGRRGAYCPNGKAGLDAEEIGAAMRAVPADRRPRTQVRDALRAALARKYPCPA